MEVGVGAGMGVGVVMVVVAQKRPKDRAGVVKVLM